MANVYDFHAYGNDGCLKIPLTLWLAMAYSVRHLLLVALGAVSAFSSRRGGGVDADYHTLFSHELMLLATIPGALVIVAAMRRVGSAGAFPRLLWSKGVVLLGASALVDLSLVAWLSAVVPPVPFSTLSLMWVIFDIYLLLYLYRSPRVRDTFADFPEKRGPLR